MADLSKFKRRNSLGDPPPPEEASRNLAAPETAPVSPVAPEAVPPPPVAQRRRGGETKPAPGRAPIRLDGRTLRKTNRTLTFATRVTPEFDERFRHVAQRDGLLLAEVLERALEAYETANRG